MSVGDAFAKVAQDYDAERPLLVPCFDEFYGAALAAVGRLPAGARVLDLGAGTGLFAGMLAARRPDLRCTLVDLAAPMLEKARARFAALGVRVETVAGDYSEALPKGPWDAVISALSIHHLDDMAKRRLFGRVAASLASGGVFVNAEQVAGRDAAEEAAFDDGWEAGCLEKGADAEMIARARERMAHDRCATLEDQLGWLRQAGLETVSVPFREGRFAVIAARE